MTERIAHATIQTMAVAISAALVKGPGGVHVNAGCEGNVTSEETARPMWLDADATPCEPPSDSLKR
jgi:hypothetical protein